MGNIAAGIKRFILWDYRRAVWQYDVMVGVILLFVFLTPRAWFRDQPKPSSVVMLPSERGSNVFWMEPELLADVPEAQRPNRASALIKARTGKKQNVFRLEPIFDAEHDTKGYMAFTTP
jgi:hypothetical protein